MSTYPSLAAYTADVIAAREAYAADMAVQEGVCADCKRCKVTTRWGRRCSSCRKHRPGAGK